MIKKTLTLLSFVLLVTNLLAQQGITGKVLDDTNQPLPGVNISVKGTSIGTITDFNGSFTIAALPEQTIVFSFMGYQTKEVVVKDQTTFNVTLALDSKVLDELVVTALGIKREKKALGYAVQDIKSDDLTQAGDANVVNTLQGKVAGVQINMSGAGTGGSSRIDIRGIGSLDSGNEPIWVIDGVPFDNSNGDENETGGVSIWGGTSRAGGAFDLNPEDIESISVLKGANAAALYGERGANGVIMVTTKKGKRNQSLGINYSGSLNVSEAAYMLDLQDQYGQGSQGVYDKFGDASWGPKMEGQQLESWTGETIPYEAQKNRLKDFTRLGLNQSHNVSFTGGNEKGSFRASIGHNIMNGIYEDHQVNKTTFDIRSDYDINDWVNIDTKVSYFVTEGQERPEVGQYSYVSYYNRMPMNVRNQDLKPGYDLTPNGGHIEKTHIGAANANVRNPYFLQEQTTNEDHKRRFFGYAALNFKIFEFLTAKVKYGIDTYAFRMQDGYRFPDNIDNNRPNYNTTQTNFTEQNLEFLLSFNKKINDDFELSLNYGGNLRNNYRRTLRAESGKLPTETDFFLKAGSNISANEEIIEEEVRSMYGFGQLSFRNMVYLDLTGRYDISSTLTAPNRDYDNAYFYPSVSLSGIVSEMFTMPSWITFVKTRLSYATVNKGTSPHLTYEGYKLDRWNYGLTIGKVSADRVDPELVPERVTSVEVGADLRFLKNRLGFDFTLYNEDTENQILKLERPQSAGYETKLTNAGLIRNRGVELMIKTVPVKTKDLTINLDFNFSKNEGVLEELEGKREGVPEEMRAKRHSFGNDVWAFEGEKLGDIRGTSFVYNENGKIIVDSNGLPVRSNETYGVLLGNIQPDWIGSINLSANYKGFFLSTSLAVQQGGSIISSSEQAATAAGNSERTTANNRMSFFVDGVTEEGGERNHVIVGAEEYWRHISSIDEAFVYDASYMKLKELVIGYNIPRSLLKKIPRSPIQRAKVSLIGRNLFYFYRDTPGTAPDASAFSSSYSAQAYDYSPVPGTRTYGFSLNIGF